jgi:tetratricopeptide (TPR) repeat protein
VLIEASELYGRVLTGVGRLGEGISYIARAMDDAAALFGRDSVHIGYYGANLAARQLQAGEFDAALASVDRGLAVSAVVPGPDSGLHAFSHHVRGRILLAARKGSAAVEQLDLAIEKLRSAGTRSAQRLAAARSERALALAYTGAIDEALADLHALDDPLPRIVGIVERLSGAWGRALASQRKALGAVQSTGGENEIRSSVLTEMGLNQLELGDLDAAAASLEEALALSRRLQRRMVPDHADILVGLGRVALMRGRPHEALPLLEEADAFWRQFDGRSRWAGDTSLHLSRAYGALGRHAEEAAARSRATRILEPETTGRT